MARGYCKLLYWFWRPRRVYWAAPVPYTLRGCEPESTGGVNIKINAREPSFLDPAWKLQRPNKRFLLASIKSASWLWSSAETKCQSAPGQQLGWGLKSRNNRLGGSLQRERWKTLLGGSVRVSQTLTCFVPEILWLNKEVHSPPRDQEPGPARAMGQSKGSNIGVFVFFKEKLPKIGGGA